MKKITFFTMERDTENTFNDSWDFFDDLLVKLTDHRNKLDKSLNEIEFLDSQIECLEEIVEQFENFERLCDKRF